MLSDIVIIKFLAFHFLCDLTSVNKIWFFLSVFWFMKWFVCLQYLLKEGIYLYLYTGFGCRFYFHKFAYLHFLNDLTRKITDLLKFTKTFKVNNRY